MFTIENLIEIKRFLVKIVTIYKYKKLMKNILHILILITIL